MIYLQNDSLNEFIANHSDIDLNDKKILIVAGDSWTNNLYLSKEERWPYKLGILKKYDYVFNISTDYGSNEEIYINLLNFLNFKYIFNFKYAKHNKNVCDTRPPVIDRCDFKTKYNITNNMDIIVGWSTPIRDKGPLSYLYEPFDTSTIPDIDSSSNSSILWKTYFSEWLNIEHHSYKTQLYILFLQEYCKIHNINWYSFMAFTPLVEKEFKNTKWDLRKHIDENNLFGLYGYPTNMQEYLIQNQYNSNYTQELPILEMQYMETDSKIEMWTSKFKKLINFKDLFIQRRNFFLSDNHTVFSGDGHPWTVGTTLMADLLATKI
jgi:hypothetical protein